MKFIIFLSCSKWKFVWSQIDPQSLYLVGQFYFPLPYCGRYTPCVQPPSFSILNQTYHGPLSPTTPTVAFLGSLTLERSLPSRPLYPQLHRHEALYHHYHLERLSRITSCVCILVLLDTIFQRSMCSRFSHVTHAITSTDGRSMRILMLLAKEILPSLPCASFDLICMGCWWRSEVANPRQPPRMDAPYFLLCRDFTLLHLGVQCQVRVCFQLSPLPRRGTSWVHSSLILLEESQTGAKALWPHV